MLSRPLFPYPEKKEINNRDCHPFLLAAFVVLLGGERWNIPPAHP